MPPLPPAPAGTPRACPRSIAPPASPSRAYPIRRGGRRIGSMPAGAPPEQKGLRTDELPDDALRGAVRPVAGLVRLLRRCRDGAGRSGAYRPAEAAGEGGSEWSANPLAQDQSQPPAGHDPDRAEPLHELGLGARDRRRN